MKYLLILLLPYMLFGDTLESIFKNSGTTGSLMFYHYNIDKKDPTKDATASAIGGDLKFTTDSSNKLFGTLGFHNSSPVFNNKHKNLTNLFNNDKNAKALTAISESYLAYNTKNTLFKVGNFLLNTPLINSSSARIVPWSYQGASLVINNIFKSSIQLNYINKVRKYTSDKYTKQSLAGEIDNGIAMFGFKHHPIDPLDVHIYYYNAPSLYDSSFLQVDYKDTLTSDNILFCVGFQNIKTYDNQDVNLIGMRTGIFIDHLDMTINYTKNNGEDKAIAYGGLSKIYTSSMITNGRGADKPETWMLKADLFFELIDKHNTEFSIWLADVKSESSEYKSYYGHIKHITNYFAKLYVRYEYKDYEDNKLDEKYFRFITSFDF